MSHLLVTIFQVKDEHTRESGNMSLDMLRKLKGMEGHDYPFRMNDYEVVFGEKDLDGLVFFFTKDKSDAALMELFFDMTNNPGRHKDRVTLVKHHGFKGRSISMGDVFRITRTQGKGATTSYYYCDRFGFTLLPNVVKVPLHITVGTLASGSYFTDVEPFEVIKVSETGQTVHIREMDAKPAEGYDYFGSQNYTYTSNENGRVYVARRRKNGSYKTKEGMRVWFGSARKYEDPHF